MGIVSGDHGHFEAEDVAHIPNYTLGFIFCQVAIFQRQYQSRGLVNRQAYHSFAFPLKVLNVLSDLIRL